MAIIAILGMFVLTSCNKEVEDNIDRYDVFRSNVSCNTGTFLALGAEFNNFPVGTPVELKNRLMVIGGISVELSTETNSETGFLNGVKTNVSWGNSDIQVTLKAVDNLGDQPIVLDCLEEEVIMPPGMLMNELPAMQSEVLANPNCDIVVQSEFEIIRPGFANILVPAGQPVGFPAANQIDLGVHTLVVNDVDGEGTVTVFTLNGEAFSIPFVETFTSQPRFVCQQPNGTLTNDQAGLLTEWNTTLGSCNLLLQENVQIDGGPSFTAGVTIELISTGIVFDGTYVLAINAIAGEGVETEVRIGPSAQPFTVAFGSEVIGQLWFVCEGAPGVLTNQINLVNDDWDNAGNCQLLIQQDVTIFPPAGGSVDISAGTPVTLVDANTIDLGGIYTLTINATEGIGNETDVIINNGAIRIVPFEESLSGQLRLECGSPIGSLTNEMPQFLAAWDALGNCPLVLEQAYGSAPVDNPVVPSASAIDIVGEGILVLDTLNGDLTTVVIDNLPYIVPLQNGGGELRLACNTAPSLTNQIQELQNALNCDLVSLGSAFQGAPVGTEVLVFNGEIILMNNQTLVIDTLNGTEVLFVTSSGSFTVPIAGAMANTQIFLECEQAVVLSVVGFYHGEYNDLVNVLGGTSTSNSTGVGTVKVFLSTGKVFLDNSCSERYTIPSEGIDYPIELNVDIVNNEIIQYGFKLDNGSTTTQHWYEHPTGQRVRFILNGNHSSRFSNSPPGTPGNDGFINVELLCQ